MKNNTIWNELQAEMDAAFNTRQTPCYRKPLTDIEETDKAFITTLEVPGVEKKDIKITTTDSGVQVKVEKAETKSNHLNERRYKGFYRYFSLPRNIDKDSINASYKNGILELTIPKTEVKEIPIN